MTAIAINRKKKKRAIFGKRFKMTVGGTILAIAVLGAIFAPLLTPWDPDQQDLMVRLKPGFWSDKGVPGHFLGTDNYGRDLLSRLIYGSRLSIMVGVSAMLLSALIGSTAGVIAGLKGGWTEQVIMRFADAQMAFPDILLAILMVAALGGNAVNLILVLGISRWMVYARVVFGLTRSLKQRPFVEAATLYGGGDFYVMRRHIIPQVAPVLIVVATLQVAQMILQETALSFLGLGLPANFAGLSIIALVWGVNMLGNGLREHYDPKMVGR